MSEREKNRVLTERLAHYYEAPEPAGKRAFFRSLAPRRIGLGQMLLVQLGYLSKWVWPLSALLFLAMLGACFLRIERPAGIVFGMTPFLVLLSVTELARSLVCKMEELEAATVCSLSGILMARMLILGAENLLFLCVAAVLLEGNVLANLLYLLTPYLLTTAASLGCVRRLRGHDPVTVCGVIAASVCLLQIVTYENGYQIYNMRYLAYWAALFAAGVCLTAHEIAQTVRQTGVSAPSGE